MVGATLTWCRDRKMRYPEHIACNQLRYSLHVAPWACDTLAVPHTALAAPMQALQLPFLAEKVPVLARLMPVIFRYIFHINQSVNDFLYNQTRILSPAFTATMAPRDLGSRLFSPACRAG